MSESPPVMKSSVLDSTDGITRATTPIQRQHVSYYLKDDPMAIFLVENQLFKIHRHYLLEGSEVFRDMFTCPTGEGVDPEGMSDQRPISLPRVTVKEFEALLDYFYRPPHLKPECSKEQCLQFSLDLLSISHHLAFDAIFQYVIEDLRSAIEDVPAIEIFLIGQKYNLKEWLLSAYDALIDRATPLTAHEVEVLGPDKVSRCVHAREAMYRGVLQAELDRERERICRLKARRSGQDQSVYVAPITHRSTRSYVEEFFQSEGNSE